VSESGSSWSGSVSMCSPGTTRVCRSRSLGTSFRLPRDAPNALCTPRWPSSRRRIEASRANSYLPIGTRLAGALSAHLVRVCVPVRRRWWARPSALAAAVVVIVAGAIGAGALLNNGSSVAANPQEPGTASELYDRILRDGPIFVKGNDETASYWLVLDFV